jgi:hypothetical protein
MHFHPVHPIVEKRKKEKQNAKRPMILKIEDCSSQQLMMNQKSQRNAPSPDLQQ